MNEMLRLRRGIDLSATTPKSTKVLKADEKVIEEFEQQKEKNMFQASLNIEAYNRKLARANARYALREKLSKELKTDLR